MKDFKKSECACGTCVEACKSGSPGWFLPGEAEKAAKLLGITFQAFKDKYLIMDYWVGLDEYNVLVPAKTLNKIPLSPTGQRVNYGYAFISGRCVFLDDKDRCRIHKAKPFECAAMGHENTHQNVRGSIAIEWEKWHNAAGIEGIK